MPAPAAEIAVLPFMDIVATPAVMLAPGWFAVGVEELANVRVDGVVTRDAIDGGMKVAETVIDVVDEGPGEASIEELPADIVALA